MTSDVQNAFQGFDDDVLFLAFAYEDFLFSEESTVDPDRKLARSRFDHLSISLAAPANVRLNPPQNVAWLSDQQLLEISADICEDLVRRKLLYDDEGSKFDILSLHVAHWTFMIYIVSSVRYRDDYTQQRNNAREIMATLPIPRMEDLARDIWCELAQRFPEFTEEVCLWLSESNVLNAMLRFFNLHQPSSVSREHLRSIKIESPIAFLPAELLSLIFEFTQEDEGIDEIRVAIACSHVCQFWRNVALHTASLWTIINLRHTGCEVFADRSLILPIRVAIMDDSDVDNPNTGAYYRNARPTWLHRHSSRVQTVSLHGPRQTLENVTSCLDVGLSALVSLQLTFTSHDRGRIFQLHAPNLRQHAPNLCRLNFCAVRMDLHECSNLTYLTLERVRFAAKEILSLLQRSPRLHLLSLFNLVLERWHEVELGLVVDLIHLGVLRLERIGAKTKEYLMAHIHIPDSAPLFHGFQIMPRDASVRRPLAMYSKSLRIL